jgi:hypothetical protein
MMPTESRTSPRRIQAKQRQKDALELRLAGASLALIAERLGFKGAQGAQYAIESSLKYTLEPAATALRQLDTQRLERLLFAVWPQAIRGDLGAIDRALRILSQRARLLGLEQPMITINQDNRTQQVTFQVVYDQPPGEKAAFPAGLDATLSLEDGSNSPNGHSNPS